MDRVIPFSTQRITNPYGNGHNGIDLGWRADESQNVVFANSLGTVYATLDNIPNGSEAGGGWGNYVLVRHDNGMFSRYAHLQNGLRVSAGQRVDENTPLGVIGDSGRAYGRHLHYEVQTGESSNTRIDPTPYLVEPIYVEPAPQPTPAPSEEFNIGDRVVVSGVATEDSYGNGNQTAPYGGNPDDESDIRYITALNMEAPRPYHISVGNTLGDGDRGWVSKDQIRKI